jgi:hypothetical protein
MEWSVLAASVVALTFIIIRPWKRSFCLRVRPSHGSGVLPATSGTLNDSEPTVTATKLEFLKADRLIRSQLNETLPFYKGTEALDRSVDSEPRKHWWSDFGRAPIAPPAKTPVFPLDAFLQLDTAIVVAPNECLWIRCGVINTTACAKSSIRLQVPIKRLQNISGIVVEVPEIQDTVVRPGSNEAYFSSGEPDHDSQFRRLLAGTRGVTNVFRGVLVDLEPGAAAYLHVVLDVKISTVGWARLKGYPPFAIAYAIAHHPGALPKRCELKHRVETSFSNPAGESPAPPRLAASGKRVLRAGEDRCQAGGVSLVELPGHGRAGLCTCLARSGGGVRPLRSRLGRCTSEVRGLPAGEGGLAGTALGSGDQRSRRRRPSRAEHARTNRMVPVRIRIGRMSVLLRNMCISRRAVMRTFPTYAPLFANRRTAAPLSAAGTPT